MKEINIYINECSKLNGPIVSDKVKAIEKVQKAAKIDKNS